MNDIELLARLRDEVPLAHVSPRAEHLFHSGLESQGAAGPRRRRPAVLDLVRTARPAWRLVLAGSLAAVLAGGAIAAAGLNSRAAAPRPTPLSLAELTYRTSAAAALAPDVRPGQWVYREYAGDLPLYLLTDYKLPGSATRWATADDRVNAFFYHGKLVVGPWGGCCLDGGHAGRIPIFVPPVSFASLGSLPADPHALARFLAHVERQSNPWVAPGFAYIGAMQLIADMLTSYVMPPRLTAELYRAMGDFPGIRVDDHAVDAAGRHGIGFLLNVPGAGFQEENVVNPRTYQFMGWQAIWPQKYHDGYAVVRQALVSGPGVTP